MAAVTGTIERGTNVGLDHDRNVISRLKTITVKTDATVDDTDTISIDLEEYGMSTLLGHQAYAHTTDNSVIVTEAATTAVSGTTVTITIGGSNDNDIRVVKLFGL